MARPPLQLRLSQALKSTTAVTPSPQRARSRFRRFYRPWFEVLEDRCLLAVSWISTQSGFWDVGSNWSGGQVPTAADDVTISQTGPLTVTVRDARAVNSLMTSAGNLVTLSTGGILTDTATSVLNGGLSLNGGSLTDNGPFTLGGASTWTTGTLTNNSTLTNSGTFTLASGAAMALAGTVGNTGTIVHTGTGNLQLTGTLTNQAGALYDLQSTAGITGGTFSNAGTLQKSAGGGVSTVGSTLDNSGTVTVKAGTLSFSGTVNQVSGTTLTGGIWDVVSATLDLASAPNLTANQGTVTLDGATSVFAKFNSVTTNSGTFNLLNGRGFTSTGAFTNSGTVATGSGVFSGGNFRINNQSGGLFDVGNDNGLTSFTTFTNAGTLRKSAGNGILTIGAAFTNQNGTLDVRSGTLLIDSGTYQGGTFLVSPGATFDFSRFTSTVTGTLTGSGGGTVQLAATGELIIGTLGTDTATFNFTAGTFQIQNGEINGPGTLTNAATGFLTVAGPTGLALGDNNTTTVLNNAGTIAQTGAGTLNLRTKSTLNNQGTFNIQSGQNPLVSGAGTFTNSGTLLQSAGAGPAVIAPAGFVNQGGTFNVQGGSLFIQSNATYQGGTFLVSPGAVFDFGRFASTVTGTLTGSGGGTVQLVGQGNSSGILNVGTVATDTATFNFAPGMFLWGNGVFGGPGTLTNAGDMQLVDGTAPGVGSGGTVINTGTMTWNDATGSGLSDRGSSANTFINRGTIHWLSGILSITFLNDANGLLSLEGAATKTYGSGTGTFTNKGTITDSGTGNLVLGIFLGAGTLINAHGGLVDLQSDAGVTGPNQQFINQGTVRKSGGVGTSTFSGLFFTHANGTIDVQTGTLAISRNADASTGGTFTVAAGSVLDLSGADDHNALVGTYTGSGAGHVELSSGVLRLGGSQVGELNATVLDLTGGGFLWTGGTLDAPGFLGTPTLTNQGQFTVAPGFAAAEGAPFTNSGTVNVDAGSTLTVGSMYTQTSTGTLAVQLGGTGAGQSGKLVSTGAATLDGTLSATLVSGYTPALADSITVEQYPSKTGTFASFNLPIGGGVGFTAAVNAGNVVLTSVSAATDLAVKSIDSILPVPGVAGQNESIQYTIINNGATTPVSQWVDSVYLSSSLTLDTTALLIGRQTHNGALASGGTYQTTLTAPLPGVLPGNYHVIVETDSQLLVPDTNRADNVLASSGMIGVDYNALTLGGSVNGTIASGQDVYFKIDLPAGHDVQLTGSFAALKAAELFVSYQHVPTSAVYDQLAFLPDQSTQGLTLTATQQGTYFILLHGLANAGAGQTFSLTATDLAFGLRTVSPASGANLGPVTVTLTGNGFSPTTTASLSGADGIAHAATQVLFKNSNTLFATFDLTGLSLGPYAIRVLDGSQTATDPGAFTVIHGVVGSFQLLESNPDAARVGSDATITFDYANTGDTDIPAPMIVVSNDQAQLRLPEQTSFQGTALMVLAINTTGPAGVLPPGYHGSFSVIFNNPTAGTANFFAGPVPESIPIDWNAQKDAMRPSFIDPGAWDGIFANFLADVGTTYGQYQAMLDTQATYLSQLGEYTFDAGQLLKFELQQDDNYGAIELHYQQGAMGHGHTDPNGVTLSTDLSGDVTIFYSSARRLFARQTDGSYLAAPGDLGTLTLSGGIYQLHDSDGTVTQFLPNGKIDFVQDTNGNRETSNYANGLLTNLVDSPTGDTITYSYNSQGLIDQVTDPVGRVYTFSYDTFDDLVSSSGPDGTTTYTYVNGQSAASEYALASITSPDGTQVFYQYDDRGRLIHQSGPNNADPVTFVYGLGGEVTITDASGAQSTLFQNDSSQQARTIDPLGRVGSATFSGLLSSPTQMNGPNGTQVSNVFDNSGNAVSSTDPLGQTVQSSYADPFNALQSVTDPRGDVLSNTFDARGNVIATTFADGSQEQFSYDSRGNLIQSINQLGQVTKYTYDAHNLRTGVTYADGTSRVYTYDAHRNLVTATDASGTATLSYDSADRLTRITYSDGRFVAYTYNAGNQRTQMRTSDGLIVNYAYDPLGRLSKMTDGTGALIVRYTYDSVGRLARQDNGNGTGTTYTYDLASQLTSLVNLAPNGSVQSRFDYTYDNLGHPITMKTLAGTFTYGYDLIGQLTSVVLPGGRTITYQYDSVGNRSATTDTAAGTTNYVTNNLNQYTSAGAATYQYDAAGNLIAQTDAAGTTQYTYNARGQLTTVVTPTDTFAFQYDMFGNRVAVTHNGVTTQYLFDGSSVVGQYDGSGSLIAQYTQGLGLTTRVNASGSADYYGFDATGNTAQLTDPSGAILNSYSYLPFGAPLSATGSTPNPFTFVGQSGVMEDGTGLYFMRNRWYDAVTGRFTQQDPTGTLGGLNLYAYADNSPVSLNDPQGFGPSGGGGFFIPNVPPPGAPDPIWAPHIDPATLVPNTIGSSGDIGGGTATYSTTTTVLRGGQQGPQNAPPPIVPSENLPAEYKLPALAPEPPLPPDHPFSPNFSSPPPDRPLSPNWNGSSTGEGVGGAGFLGSAGRIAGAAGPAAAVVSAVFDPRLGFQLGVSSNSGNVNNFGPRIPRGAHDATDEPTQVALQLGVERINEANLPPPVGALLPAVQFAFHPQETVNGIKQTFQNAIDFYWPQKTDKPADPNQLTGPDGFGPSRFVRPDQTFPYRIDFANEPTATAPAQTVVITQQLDPGLDLSTFQLGTIGFGNLTVTVPPGLTSFSTRVDARSSVGVFVDVTANLNLQTGLLTWTFTSIDPTTLDQPTGNPLEGFLPPDTSPPLGEGFVTYTIKPKAADTTGTVINAQATVVFDTNAPIKTKQISNTIDAGLPTSSINQLPATTANASFTVSWSGQDDASGSGIAFFDVFVSDNGGPFQPFQLGTTATSATFTGQVGHTYSFYSVATDNVGHVQTLPAAAQAIIQVVAPSAGSPDALFVAQLYRDLLAREGEAAGLAAWTAALDQGQLTRFQVVLGFESSLEYRIREVENAYHALLGRDADPGGLNASVGFLAGGASPEDLQAAIMSSPEYFQRNGGSLAGFLASVYRDGLDRVPDADGARAWTGSLESGASRLFVVDEILASAEAQADRVVGLYESLLHRAPDSQGFSSFLQSGFSDAETLAALAGSLEYLGRVEAAG